MANNNNNNKSNKGYKVTIGVLAVLLAFATTFIAVTSFTKSNAAPLDPFTTEYGPVWAEQIQDGSGRYILHIEHEVNDEEVADYLACELAYQMNFSDAWTVGAEMNDETTEVVYGEPGDTIYVRFLTDDGYMVYPIVLPGETATVKEVVEVEVPAQTETKKTVATRPATTSAQADTKKTVDTTTDKKTNTTTKEDSSEKNSTVVNETIINRTIVDEEVVNPVKETGYVYVSYVDQDNNKLTSSLEISGSIGVSYSTEQKTFDGYEFVSVDGNASGKISKATKYVVYNYKKIETEETEKPEVEEKGYIYVSYIDENGNKLDSTLEISGKVGVAFNTEQKTFDGYEFVSVDGTTNGNIQKGVEYVIYNYKKIETEVPVVENGVVNVSYVTSDGEVLGNEVISGEVGTSYSTEQKTFDGYEFVSVEGNVNGIFSKEATAVKYIYAAVKEEHIHEYVIVDSSEAKCLTDGHITYACACGDSYKEIVPAHGHNMEVYSVTEEYIEYHCSECGCVEFIYADKFVEEEVVEEAVAEVEIETETDTNADAGKETVLAEAQADLDAAMVALNTAKANADEDAIASAQAWVDAATEKLNQIQ